MNLADYLKKTPAERRLWELTPDPEDAGESVDLAELIDAARAEGHAAGVAAERARVVAALDAIPDALRDPGALADDIEAGRL